MTKIILTGVDSSRTALLAAEKAADLAASYGGALHICSAYSKASEDALESARSSSASRVTSESLDKLTAGLSKAAQDVAESVADVLRESYPELTIEVSAAAGSPADVLLAKATELGADVIVVGNKRVQGVSRILGSVARKVAAEATCDLYIAHTTPR
ncbi:MAG TPA: universal stress protein [Candidatus Corynebacterium faecigallinarum]|uniref:Universal stress protein n=1 Tax=Candidatus Corynebacterium faecigallinarum TaxID=2838528 RepID=A0A9D2TPH8_9CORY|nr:universal stress protein [Candidatus Corynebacterium faecigallinarum]